MTRHYTSREFNQDTARAKRETREGPVFITDRGEPKQVLLSIDEYRRLMSKGKTVAELLASDDDLDIDFEAGRRLIQPPREIDFD